MSYKSISSTFNFFQNKSALQIILSIPEHFYVGTLARSEPGPPMNLIGWSWTDLAARERNLGSSPGSVFSYFTLQNEWAAHPSPSPGRKLRPDVSSGTVMTRFSLPEITEFFSAQLEKCLGMSPSSAEQSQNQLSVCIPF
jgi:hypothetical protein